MGPFTSVLLRGRPVLLFAQRELARILFFHAENLRIAKMMRTSGPRGSCGLTSENAPNIVVPIFSGADSIHRALGYEPNTLATALLRC